MSEQTRRPDEPERLADEIENDRDTELSDARELAAEREHFARGILELPDTYRLRVLGDDLAGPRRGRRWSIDKIEACWRRLRELERSTADTALTLRVKRLAVHKRRIERVRDRMILANLRLVAHLVGQIGNYDRVPYMDLVQEGNMGLMRAVDRFDPELGNRFSTYAFWWIRQAIFKALDEKARIIRLPAHVVNGRRALAKVRKQFQEEHDREPTPAEIAERLGISPRKARELSTVVADPQPLEPFGADDPGMSLHERLPAEAPSALDALLDDELREHLRAALNVLSEREAAIIRLRIGIGRTGSLTLREIGAMLGLTRERVRQIEHAALAKIGAAEHELFGHRQALTA